MKNVRLSFILAMLIGMTFANSVQVAGATLKIGDPAPKLQVAQWVQGEPVKAFDTNHVYIVEFWATWCGPCRLEGKLLERVVENFRNEPAAVFLAVNVDEDRAGVPAFLKEVQWTTQVAYAQGLDRLLGVQALPTLVIFDRKGRVVFRQEGLVLSSFVETLDKKVREALSGLPQAASR